MPRGVPPTLLAPALEASRTPFSPTSPNAYLSPTGLNGGRRWPMNDGCESASGSSTDESQRKQERGGDARQSTLLLFWPRSVVCADPTGEQWTIGWNPQGLVVVVAGFINAATLNECDAILSTLREQVADEVQLRLEKIRHRELRMRRVCAGVQHAGEDVDATPVYDDITNLEDTLRLVRHLKVIGRLNYNEAESDSDTAEGHYLSTRRREADIWLELVSKLSTSQSSGSPECVPELPSVKELLCCSYRHSAALHVVPYEPGQNYSTQATSMTALSLVPDAGLSQLGKVASEPFLTHTSRKDLLLDQNTSTNSDELADLMLAHLEKQRKEGFILAPGALSILEGVHVDRHAQHVLGHDEPVTTSLPRCVALIGSIRSESNPQANSTLDDDADGFFSSSPSRRERGDLTEEDNASAQEEDEDDDNSGSVRRHSSASESQVGNESIVTNDSSISYYADVQGTLSAHNYLCRAQRLIVHLKGGESFANNSSMDSSSHRRAVSNDSISRSNNSFLDVRSVLFSMLAMPPRLSFKTTTSATEFNIVLSCCNHSLWLQKKVTGLALVQPSTTTPLPPPLPTKLASSLLHEDAVTIWDVALEKGDAVLSSGAAIARALLSIIVPLCAYSYVARFTEFRLQMTLNAIALARGQSSTCGLHPGLPHCVAGTTKRQRSLCILGFVAQVAFDCLLGIVASYLLYQYEEVFHQVFRTFAWHGLHDLHLGYLEWFVGWPAGFKMNDDLNVLLAGFSNAILEGWRLLVYSSPDFHWLSVALLPARLLSPLGLGFGLSLVADYCNICTLHLRNTFHVFKVVYRGYLGLLSSLTNQFQGRRFNPLKNRIDMGSFDHDQMLLGTLIATAAVFLFPTLAMYYFYFAIVRTSVWVVQEGLCGASFAISFLPIGQIIYWWLYKNTVTCGVFFSRVKVEMVAATGGSSSAASAATPVVCLALGRTPMEFSEALHDWKFVMRTCLRPLAPGRLVSFIVSATHKPAINPRGTIYGHLVGAQGEPFLPNLSLVHPNQESSSS